MKWYYLTPFTTRLSRESVVFLLGTSFFSCGSAINDLLFNLYLKERGLGEGVIGSSISSTALGIMVMALPAALFARRFSARRLLMICSLIEAMMYSARAATDIIALIPFFNILIGAAGAALRVLPAVVMMTLANPLDRPRLFGYNSAAMMSGIMIGNVLGGVLPVSVVWVFGIWVDDVPITTGYQWSFLISTIILCLASVAFSKLPKQARPETTRLPQQRQPRAYALPPRHKIRQYLILIFPHTLVAIGAGAVIPFIPLYLKTEFNQSVTQIGTIMGGIQAVVALGYMVSPTISERYGVLKSIIAVQSISLPFMAIVGFGDSITGVVLALGCRNLLMNMSAPFVDQYHMEAVAEDERVFLSGLDHTLWNASWSIIPVIAGMVIEGVGYELLFLFTLFLYGLSSVLYAIRLNARHRNV